MSSSSSSSSGGGGGGGTTSIISIPPEVGEEFKKMKTRRAYKYMILQLKEDFSLSVAKTGPPTSTARDFIKALPTSDSRYAVFDMEITAKSGMKSSKIMFFLWTPDASTGRSKMFYTSQRRTLDTVFTGVEDVQSSKVEDIAKILGEKSLIVEEEAEWDPDA